MSELMKSIREMQSSGQNREEEANKLRREAEAKVAELEKTLAVTRGELNVFTHEKSSLKDSLETMRKRFYHGLYGIFFFSKNYQV